MKNLRLPDGTLWPDPEHPDLADAIYTAIHHYGSVDEIDIRRLRGAAQAYCALTENSTMTLKDIMKKISMIRKAKRK